MEKDCLSRGEPESEPSRGERAIGCVRGTCDTGRRPAHRVRLCQNNPQGDLGKESRTDGSRVSRESDCESCGLS